MPPIGDLLRNYISQVFAVIKFVEDSGSCHSLFRCKNKLNAWRQAGKHRHWMIPLKKGAQYDEIQKLGKGDRLVRLKTSPQARKKWPELGEEMTARLLTFTRKGKACHLLTSMTDAMRYPGGEMADLYSHRWEIELGYRETKQTMQLSRLSPELMRDMESMAERVKLPIRIPDSGKGKAT